MNYPCYWLMKKIVFIALLIPPRLILYNMDLSTPGLTDIERAKKEAKAQEDLSRCIFPDLTGVPSA